MSELNFLQAIILSVIQAITEFIPVSSSAHLLLPSKLLGWPDQGQFFDISVHFGSLVAVILHFRDSLLSRNFYTSNFFLLLIVATIPIIAFTLIFNGITDLRWSLTSIAISNILFAFLLLISTKIKIKNTNKKDINQLTINGALTIGLWQTLSIISGASRSGTVITGALFLGYRPEDAAKFSIYLSIPTLLGAMFFGIIKNDILKEDIDILMTFSSILISFIVSFFTIKWFLLFVKKVGFLPFIIYRLFLGVSILWLI